MRQINKTSKSTDGYDHYVKSHSGIMTDHAVKIRITAERRPCKRRPDNPPLRVHNNPAASNAIQTTSRPIAALAGPVRLVPVNNPIKDNIKVSTEIEKAATNRIYKARSSPHRPFKRDTKATATAERMKKGARYKTDKNKGRNSPSI